MKKTYEKTLPEGYLPSKIIDAKDTKLGVILNLIASGVSVIIIIISFIIIKPNEHAEYSYLKALPFIISIFVYIILHELVHGIAYKLLTGQKLTFGLSFTVAYCGVPDIFVYRKTALIALLSPFVVFLFVFGLLAVFLPGEWERFYSVALLAFHIGGCSGDLYCTILYLFKFKGSSTLMQDTGPRQTFYEKK